MLNKLGRTRLVEVLLVEDSPTDAILLEEAFKDTKIPNNLHIVTTGEDALAYLRHEGVHAKSLMPDLIMLDLNLPGISGQDVLKTIKGDEKLQVDSSGRAYDLEGGRGHYQSLQAPRQLLRHQAGRIRQAC